MTFDRERIAVKMARFDHLGRTGIDHEPCDCQPCAERRARITTRACRAEQLAEPEFDHNEAFHRHLLDQVQPVDTAWQECDRCGEHAVLAEARIGLDTTARICGACETARDGSRGAA